MIVDTFLNIADTLDFMPYKFPKEPYINKENIRFIPKWSYKIIYAIEEDDIIILNVFGTSQDPDLLFLTD